MSKISTYPVFLGPGFLAGSIMSMIVDSVLKQDDQSFGARALMAKFNVTQLELKEALDALASAGFIELLPDKRDEDLNEATLTRHLCADGFRVRKLLAKVAPVVPVQPSLPELRASREELCYEEFSLGWIKWEFHLAGAAKVTQTIAHNPDARQEFAQHEFESKEEAWAWWDAFKEVNSTIISPFAWIEMQENAHVPVEADTYALVTGLLNADWPGRLQLECEELTFGGDVVGTQIRWLENGGELYRTKSISIDDGGIEYPGLPVVLPPYGEAEQLELPADEDPKPKKGKKKKADPKPEGESPE